jgi:hypothetical protein
MYCFHDKIRIYFISFIVQIPPFVHLFTLKIVFRWEVTPPWTPHQGPALILLGALTGPQTPRRKLCLHFILYLHVATPLILAVCIQRKCKVYSINATFVTSYNTTKVRSLDVIVPRPSTNINTKRISITRIYFAFFWGVGIEMTDWMNLLCWYIFIINAMRSCNERTTLHYVESYLYYII